MSFLFFRFFVPSFFSFFFSFVLWEKEKERQGQHTQDTKALSDSKTKTQPETAEREVDEDVVVKGVDSAPGRTGLVLVVQVLPSRKHKKEDAEISEDGSHRVFLSS